MKKWSILLVESEAGFKHIIQLSYAWTDDKSWLYYKTHNFYGFVLDSKTLPLGMPICYSIMHDFGNPIENKLYEGDSFKLIEQLDTIIEYNWFEKHILRKK